MANESEMAIGAIQYIDKEVITYDGTTSGTGFESFLEDLRANADFIRSAIWSAGLQESSELARTLEALR